MREVEVKILEIDRGEIEARIYELEALKVFEGELHALFFDDTDGAITQKGDVLRIRKEGEETVMAYKQHISRSEAKIMQEYEIRLPEMDQMIQILGCMGYNIIKETRKVRTEYEWNHIKFVIDEYLGDLSFIPVFLEIEALSTPEIEHALNMLEISKDKAKSWSTYDLIQFYG